jgi:hypothetical protein
LIEWERESYAYTHVNLFDVVYTDHHKIIDLNYIEGIASDLLLNRADDSSSTREKLEKRLEGLYMAVAFFAPQMKNSYFREEQEVRIVAPLMRNTLASRISQKATREVHTRFRDGQPIPFIKVFEGAEGLPIKRVIVGPQQDQERVAYALELALEAQGLAVEIVRSQISYRP